MTYIFSGVEEVTLTVNIWSQVIIIGAGAMDLWELQARVLLCRGSPVGYRTASTALMLVSNSRMPMRGAVQ